MLLKKTPFVGRKKELKKLKNTSELIGARIIVVQGRRRTGKTRLIEKFSEGKRFLYFAGISPKIAGQESLAQINRFIETVTKYFNVSPKEVIKNWHRAFWFLSNQLTEDIPTVIMFDEISWMGTGDDYFVSILKAWWDEDINWHYANLVFIISGSVSTWIEKNIVRSTALYGRISAQIELMPLSLPEAIRLLRKIGYKTPLRDLMDVLVIVGGIPWYLEQFNPNVKIEQNLLNLFFEKNSLLEKEFDTVFHDLFNGDRVINKQILEFLIDGSKPLELIAKHFDWPEEEHEKLAEMLSQLEIAGFVRKSYQWSIKTDAELKTYIYSVDDCFIRFYLKYVEGLSDKLKKETFIYNSSNDLPAWSTIKGLQLETLLLQNRALIFESVRLSMHHIANAGPFLQRGTKDKKGCQIDFLIQTKDGEFYVCEFKFGKQKIGLEIIDEMKEKISRLDVPKGAWVKPFLFHFGEVAPEVTEANYFMRVINYLEVCAEEDEV